MCKIIMNFVRRVPLIESKKFLFYPKFIYVYYVIKRGNKDKNDSKLEERSYIRHCYNPKIEEMVNSQINCEFNAGYAYLNMASYFSRSDIALPGFYGFFMKMFYEEQEHAMGFIKYQTLRGGIVKFKPIITLPKTEWSDICDCFFTALNMEKLVKEDILKIYYVAENIHDTNCIDFLDGYIQDQEKSIREMSRLVTRAKLLCRNPIGKYLFDREMHETHVRKGPAECVAEIGPKLYE